MATKTKCDEHDVMTCEVKNVKADNALIHKDLSHVKWLLVLLLANSLNLGQYVQGVKP